MSLVLLFALACTRSPVDSGDSGDTAAPECAWTTCHGCPDPADRSRKVVISRPYAEDASQSPLWEVLSLSEDGELSAGGPTFEMRRGYLGEVVFTPDGAIGVAVHDDGTLGVFRLEGDEVVVVHEGFGAGLFNASQVEIAPSGEHLYVVQGDWREWGGGVYRLAMACDGTLSFEGLVAAGKQPTGLTLDPDDPARGFLYSRDLLDSAAGDTAFLLDLESPSLLASAAAFPDDLASASHAVWAGEHALVADNNMFGDPPNRVAVLGVAGEVLTALQSLTVASDPAWDPVWMVPSPLDDTVLVSSGYGNAAVVLVQDGSPDAPYRIAGEPTYVGDIPRLPAAGVVLDRGELRGLVLLAEHKGVRRLRFTPGGVEDLGLFSTPGGYEAMVGAIGVQP